MTDIFIGLGSNLGDRQDNLIMAVAMLAKIIHAKTFSPIYETAPLYFCSSQLFKYGGKRKTRHSAQQILKLLQAQELAMEGKRHVEMAHVVLTLIFYILDNTDTMGLI